MKKSFFAAAILAGFVGPASAATVIDFTADDQTSVVGFYDVTADGGGLAQVSHFTDDNCGAYACVADENGFDVGFGVFGGPNAEIDNGIELQQYVVVTFDYAVRILGFAGMLTYGDDSSDGTESVVLEYWDAVANAWLIAGIADALFDEDDVGDTPNGGLYGTVGLAEAILNSVIITDQVRFTAGGTGDQGDTNVTAAALTVAPVPIPASFPLLLAGLGALGFAARRKQRKAA